MKSLDEILKLPEYKNHVWHAAMTEFANESDDSPSLYHDSFTQRDIIYHLRNSRNLNVKNDELAIADIKTFLSKLENVSEDIYNTLTDIYNRYYALVESYGYDEDITLDLLKSYDMSSYEEMWKNEEFKTRFKADVKELVNRFRPIQKMVKEL